MVNEVMGILDSVEPKRGLIEYFKPLIAQTATSLGAGKRTSVDPIISYFNIISSEAEILARQLMQLKSYCIKSSKVTLREDIQTF